MNRLDNKVALVTGGTKGIGSSTAGLMCEAGAKVVVTARGEEAGQKFEREMRAGGHDLTFIRHDVSSIEDWKKVIDSISDQHGGLHVLVNNAAIGFHKLFVDYTADDYEKMFDINVKGVFFGIYEALPLMKSSATETSPGSIINLSTASVTNSTAGESCYNATKGAIQSLSHSLAREFGEEGYNVRVNTVNPGFVWTKMAQDSFQEHVESGEFASVDDAKAFWVDRYYPIGRLADPDDVAKLIVFLASDDASYITGGKYAVDGGETA